VTCYRLYSRDVPEVPLVIDRYEQWVHVTEYDRPHDRTPAEHADWLDLMVRTIAEVLEVPRKDVFLKRRQRLRDKDQYEPVARVGRVETVHEAGLKFRVNLTDYVDTGLFLDHRITRGMVRDAADGTRFLNLFGYTGSFTVYAAAGGAAKTVTVDSSATYLDWARENLRLNDLDGPRHEMVRQDARAYLLALPPTDCFDLVVVDPPTFSNTKDQGRPVWDVQRDHAELLHLVLRKTARGGTVFFSTNFRRFKFDEAALERLATVREISRQTVPPEYRDKRIHQCWRLMRRES